MAHRYHLDNSFFEQSLQFGDISLVQIGLMRCKPGDVVAAHVHKDYFELSIVVNGNGEILTNGEAVAVKPNDIHVSYSFESHEVRSSAESPLQYMFCAFKTQNREYLKRLLEIKSVFHSALSRVIHSQTLTTQVEYALKKINSTSELLHEELMHAVLSEIIMLTIGAFYKQDKPDLKISQSQELCYQIMAYINENVSSLDSLQDITQEFKYDYAYLSRLFKSTTGQTLAAYYQNIRFQTAKSLIEQNYKLTEIATMLHFASLYSFSKSFKSFYNISPSAYKKSVSEHALFNKKDQESKV